MKLRIPMPNSLFRVGVLLMIVKVLSSHSSILEVPDTADTALSLAACLFFAGSVLQKKYPAPTLFAFLVLCALGLLTSLRTGNLMIFIAILSCVAMCREDLDKSVRFILFWETLYVVTKACISFVLHGLGHSMLTNVSGEMMYNFGFSHPNIFASVATNLFAMYLWLHFESMDIRKLIGLCGAMAGVYVLTGSRTALIVTAFLLLGYLVMHGRKKVWGLLRLGAQVAVPLMAVFFGVMCSKYTTGNPLIMALDSVLSKRIKLGAYYLERFGISLLGQNVTNIEVKWDPFWRLNGATFDNIYTYLLVTQTIWLFVIILLFFRAAKKGGNKTCVFLLSWVLYGISEIHVINPYLYFVILLIPALLDKSKEATLCPKT